MSYNIACSTKILTLVIASFLFISAGVLCEFTIVPDIHILLFPHEEDLYSSAEGTDVHTWQHTHQKDVKLCLPLYYND